MLDLAGTLTLATAGDDDCTPLAAPGGAQLARSATGIRPDPQHGRTRRGDPAAGPLTTHDHWSRANLSNRGNAQ